MKRRMHPTARAEQQVFEALCCVAIAVERQHPTTVAAMSGLFEERAEWFERRLLAARASGMAILESDGQWSLTSDGWDRVRDSS